MKKTKVIILAAATATAVACGTSRSRGAQTERPMKQPLSIVAAAPS